MFVSAKEIHSLWDDWDKNRNIQKLVLIENHVTNQRKKVKRLIIINEWWIKKDFLNKIHQDF